MAILKIPYQFHDALLEEFQIGPQREVLLRISLYPVFYPGSPVVSVRFSDVANLDTVRTYFSKLGKPDPEMGFDRIDALHYDTKRQSTEGKLFFYLRLNGEGSLIIHCSNCTVSGV